MGATGTTRWLLLLLLPILLLPLLSFGSSPSSSKTAYSLGLIAAYWATEPLPIAVTSLLPLILFPLLGVLPAERVSRNYFRDTNILFFGGLVIAAALEAVRLHERIALKVLLLFGMQPHRLLLGFMSATAFLSMWMSNTATTAMMMPIAEAVLQSLEACHREGGEGGEGGEDGEGGEGGACSGGDTKFGRVAPRKATVVANHASTSLGKALMLAIAFSANIGGMATLTGTGPNVVLAGDIRTIYPSAPALSFATWMAFALPLSLVLLALTWALLCAVHIDGWLRWRVRRGAGGDSGGIAAGGAGATVAAERADARLRAQHAALGPISDGEAQVAAVFGTLAILWVTRAPGFLPGWGRLFVPGHVTDATSAVVCVIALFVLPERLPAGWRARQQSMLPPAPRSDARHGGGASLEGEGGAEGGAIELGAAPGATEPAAARRRAPPPPTSSPPPSPPLPPLLTWRELERRVPWGVLLLLGGGFALADACEASGLTREAGTHLHAFRELPLPLLRLALMLIVSVTTTVTSNVATASVFIPISSSLAESIGIHPLALAVPGKSRSRFFHLSCPVFPVCHTHIFPS